MTDAMQTIQEALIVLGTGCILTPMSIYIDSPSSMVPKVANKRECKEIAEAALTALDSLAVEPSEDVRDVAWYVYQNYGHGKNNATAYITARDKMLTETISRKCADRGKKKFRDMVKSPNQRDIPAFKSFRDKQAEELYAYILTPEAT